MFSELIKRNRSYRRFYQKETVSLDTLRQLVDYARLSPSGANRQPLRYWLSVDPTSNAQIYPNLAWAGYLTDWPGPVEGERPAAYIIILEDETVKMVGGVDHGIAAQSILLGAVEKGLGGCIIAAIKKEGLQEIIDLEGYEIRLVVALGKPKEEVMVEHLGPDGSVRYWRDEQQVHHVPKRSLSDLIVGEKG